jgi:hypothetical protein
MNKKIFGLVGIILTVAYLFIYVIVRYNWLVFLMGFGVIYFVFVLPLKKMK